MDNFGDLLDFVSYANIDRARTFAKESGCLMAAGNHEFSLYVGEAFEDAAYRAQSYAKVQGAFGNNIRFANREKNGLNMVVIDNGYYLFDKWQLEALKKEIEKGLPILLFMHCPLYAEDLYNKLMERSGGRSMVSQVAVPVEKMSHYNEYRFRQQKADEITIETVEYIKSQPLIKAIFVGHYHSDHDSTVTPNLPQYVTGIPTIRKITVK